MEKEKFDPYKTYVLLIVKETGLKCYCTTSEWKKYSEKTKNKVLIIDCTNHERIVRMHCGSSGYMDMEKSFDNYVISDDCLTCE